MQHKLLMILKREGGNLHILEGEYEGFRYIAADYHVKVIYHNRDNVLESIKKIKKNDQFWCSNPNSVNGNLLKDFDQIMEAISKKGGKVHLDTVYVGTVAKKYNINLNHKCIYCISWSASKSFPGTFYHRVGAVFFRVNMPEMFGNKWFKNMSSIRLCICALSKLTPYNYTQKISKISN